MPKVNRKTNKTSSQFTDGQTGYIEEKKIDIPIADNAESRKQLVARIEELTTNVIQQIYSGRLPQISYSVTRNSTDTQEIEEQQIFNYSSNFESFHTEDSTIENEQLDELNNSKTTVSDFGSRRGKEKFSLTMAIMAAVHRLLITNTTATRRSLYYDLKSESTSYLVPEQKFVDQAVNHLANLLNCAPWDLHLSPTSKGLAAGELVMTLVDDRTIDCRVPGGALIPQIASNLISIRTRARFVLVVEKDTVFQQLLEDDCTGFMNCILVTGKGYPDVATRMLVKLLSEKMGLPVYVIVDADPFGVDIMCVYRFGSATLSKENESLACPKVLWLGIHPSELLVLGANVTPLTEFDLSRLTAIEGRPYMNDSLLRELRIMRTGKAEIENVSSFSRKFLITYLSCKIKGNDCI